MTPSEIHAPPSSDLVRSSYLQIRDLVNHLQHQHRRLRNAYRNRAMGSNRRTSSQRADLMYGYLARRESDMGAFLERFSNQERDSILETWIQNVEIADYDERVDALVEDLPNEAREGMDAIEALDRALVALYDRLAQQVTAPTVQRFFRRLKEVTHRRAREHAETLQQVEDL